MYDNTVTARTYLSYIAEQAGGFACMGRDNKLYIKTISNAVAEVVPFRLFQKYSWGEEFKVSRVAYEDGIRDFKFGDTDYNTVWMNQDNMYIVDEEQVQNVYDFCEGFTCWSFEGTTVINPALDLGDMVEINGRKVVYQGKIEYKGKFKADLSSRIQAKSKEDSMVTKTSTANKIRRVQSRIDQVKGEIESLVTEVDDSSEKVSEVLQMVDGVKTTVAQNTIKIENIKSDVVNEAIKATEKELGIKLKDYPTTAQVSTIIETKAGEIETKLNGTITTQMSNYVTKSVMENSIIASINGFSSTVSQTYLTKTSASNDFVEKKKVISSINQSAEAVSIAANKINLNGAVTANDYFKINLDGSVEATSGKIAGIDLSSGGLFYSGSLTSDGFGLWKAGSHYHNGSYIIFHAGGNNANIGGAPFRVYQNGAMVASSGTIGGFRISSNALQSDSVGISANEYYAFWTKISGTTTSYITWNGDISCSTILVGGQPLVRTETSSGNEIQKIAHRTSYFEYTVNRFWSVWN